MTHIEILMLSMIFVLFIINIINDKLFSNRLAKSNNSDTSMEEAVSFLNMIIELKSKNYIESLRIQDPKFINNKYYEQALKELVPEIFNFLSKTHLDELYKYFSEKGLIEYISIVVDSNYIQPYTIELNSKVI